MTAVSPIGAAPLNVSAAPQVQAPTSLQAVLAGGANLGGNPTTSQDYGLPPVPGVSTGVAGASGTGPATGAVAPAPAPAAAAAAAAGGGGTQAAQGAATIGQDQLVAAVQSVVSAVNALVSALQAQGGVAGGGGTAPAGADPSVAGGGAAAGGSGMSGCMMGGAGAGVEQAATGAKGAPDALGAGGAKQGAKRAKKPAAAAPAGAPAAPAGGGGGTVDPSSVKDKTSAAGLTAATMRGLDEAHKYGLPLVSGKREGGLPNSDHPAGKAIDVSNVPIGAASSSNGSAETIAYAERIRQAGKAGALDVKYVIHRGQIASASSNWEWRPYTYPGKSPQELDALKRSNPGEYNRLQHNDHVHVSFN